MIDAHQALDLSLALLGAAYAAGGWATALEAGQALGLPFGGTVPWTVRYPANMPMNGRETSDVLEKLQGKLRYRFRNPMLLLEAITHPSLTLQDVPSYNRLEFLGDGKRPVASRPNLRSNNARSCP